MSKNQIQTKIDNNRNLIERALNTDLDPDLLAEIVYQLKKKNDNLIELLKISI